VILEQMQKNINLIDLVKSFHEEQSKDSDV
jgi:hypothetical protein